LILAAYEKWGENCPEFLLGEFSFAIWDSYRGRLFCSRDHLGTRPFFYWTNGFRFAFSADPLRLLSLPGIARELNRAKLVAWATRDGLAGETHEETFHKGIFSLPSATSFTFEGGQIRKRVYWEPESVSLRVPPREDDAFEALRELLFDAVECRLRGKTNVAAYLSGGLDSSALVGMAARCLERKNRGILAISAVLPENSKPQFADEREFVDEFSSLPNVTIEYVAPESGGPFDAIEDCSRFESRPTRYSRQYLLDAMQNVAVRDGMDLILMGTGGEAGPTNWGPGYLLELACDFHWYKLARELRGLRAVRNISPIRALGREIREFLSPDRSFAAPVLLAPDFLLAMEEAPSGRRFYWPNHRREHVRHVRTVMNGHALHPGRLVTQVPVAFPFKDKRVLEFCLAAPADLKVRDGYRRYLIRRALDGILPKKIQWRTTKFPFAPDYPKRYAAQLGKARDFVAAIRRKDPVRSIVDVDRLRYLLDHPDTKPAQAAALGVVPRTIYLICFLRQFAEFRP
jgi:asparagine synthase (glutamine-hydrolysing)